MAASSRLHAHFWRGAHGREYHEQITRAFGYALQQPQQLLPPASLPRWDQCDSLSDLDQPAYNLPGPSHSRRFLRKREDSAATRFVARRVWSALRYLQFGISGSKFLAVD